MRKHPAAEPQSTGPLPAGIAVAFMGLVVVSLWFDSRDGTSPALAFEDAPEPVSAAAPAARPPDNGSPLWVDRAKRLKAAASQVVSDADPVRRVEAVHEKQAVDGFFDQAAAALSPPSRGGSSA